MHTILIVDDEKDVLELARIMLDAEGYRVYTAMDGEEAPSLVSSVEPDLVLLDVVMPGLSGLDVCRELKRGEGTQSIPVVMFTVLGPEVALMLHKGEKADDYILKPFSRRVLVEKVERLLSR